MATELPMDPEYSPGLYDSATGKSLATEKVFDVTADCPAGERTLLLFTRAERGRIVQIVHPYENQKFMGSHIHFFVDEMHHPVAARDDTFTLVASRAGLQRVDMEQLIRSLAP